MVGHLLVPIEVVRNFVLAVISRRLCCGLVLKSKDGDVDALALGVLLLRENLHLVSCGVRLLNQVLHDFEITVLSCNMQRCVVAVRPRVQINARLFDYYLDAPKVATPAQVVEHVPTLVVRVVEPGLLGAISSHNLQLALQKFHELLSDFVVSLHVLELRRLHVVGELLQELDSSLEVRIHLLN